MVIKIRCSDPVGQAVMRLLAAIETCQGLKPEDLQLELDPTDTPERAPMGARTRYRALLPMLPDGTFDMARVPSVVEENLKSIGAETMNGIVYQEVVDGTLRGDVVIERDIRERRMMKAGTSQRAMVQLAHMGVILREPIIVPSE